MMQFATFLPNVISMLIIYSIENDERFLFYPHPLRAPGYCHRPSGGQVDQAPVALSRP